jgi:hypothetical protein
MTSPRLLVPLRVPELGPYLGKLVTGTGSDPGGIEMEVPRYRLATRVIECAGEARRLAARDERQAALATLGRAAWMEAWDEAVAGAAELVVERVTARLEAEALAVGMPQRIRIELVEDASRQGAMAARFGTAGVELIPALDQLEERAASALGATSPERGEVGAWQDALTLAARRLEAAWLELEKGVAAEVFRWDRVGEGVSRWRRPLWPVAAAGAAALAVAVWLGLVFGGYVDAPGWLAAAWGTVFGP